MQEYKNLRFKRASNFSMGSSERIADLSSKLSGPGPGNYEFHMKNKKSSPNYGFGSGTREKGSPTSVKSLSPGPGNYKSIYKTIGTEGAKSSIHSKILYKPIERTGGETPGPGNYNSPILK